MRNPFIILLLLAACSEPDVPNGDASGPEQTSTSSGGWAEPTSWQPCFEGGDNGLPECPGYCEKFPENCYPGEADGNVSDEAPVIFDVAAIPDAPPALFCEPPVCPCYYPTGTPGHMIEAPCPYCADPVPGERWECGEYLCTPMESDECVWLCTDQEPVG